MEQGLPSPPISRQRSRGLSFRSDRSGGSRPKVDLTGPESPREKQRRDSIWKNTSKANPNAAMNEAQPGAAHLLEQSTIESLRAFQHKDVNGNPIVDPDLSNPTRPRFERPLDTIRSFEKAIDHGYKRRSAVRAESSDPNNQHASARSSYFGGEYMKPTNRRRAKANGLSAGYDSGPSPTRYSQGGGGGGYYGNRPQSQIDGQNGPPSRVRYGNRMQSDGAMRYGNGNGTGVYPQHGYHASHDTVNTGMTNGSDSTGPWVNSTDPSSENSSIDQATGAAKPNAPQNGYVQHNGNGYPNHFGGPIMEEGGSYLPPNSYGGPIQPPPQVRRPIALGNSGSPPSLPSSHRSEPEKKKGWLKRRFSKND